MRLIILILLISNIASAQMQYDKKLHFAGGAVFGSWCYLVGENHNKGALYAVSGAAIIGTGKELYDLCGGGTPDVKDLAWTIAGGLIAAGVIEACRDIKPKFRLGTAYMPRERFSRTLPRGLVCGENKIKAIK